MKCTCGNEIMTKTGIIKCEKCGKNHGMIIKPAKNGPPIAPK